MDEALNKPVALEYRENGIALVALNRPEKHNILNDEMIRGLVEQFEKLHHNPDIRVVIINAKGRNFCAGADLQRLLKVSESSEEENYQDALQLSLMLKKLSTFPKPTIALTHGRTYGGGLGLIACCDIVISADDATFCFSETRLGLLPSIIAPFTIAAIGSRHARYYFLTAEAFDSNEAARIGLVHQVVAESTLFDTGMKIANTILHNGPHALAAAKKLIEYFENINDDVLKQTSLWNAQIRKTPEGQEGVKAFFEKRLPNWIEQD